MTMTLSRLSLGLIAAGLPALLALTGCQPPAASTQPKGIVVVKARLSSADRQVQAVRPRPIKASQINYLRISLVNPQTLDVLEQDIASPGADVTVAFRNLHAQTTYRVEARAFTSMTPVNGNEEALATTALVIDNELTPTLADLNLQLADVTFDAHMTATGVTVIPGVYDTAATTTARVDYEEVVTLAGSGDGWSPAYLDGPANQAEFGEVRGLAEAGGMIYLGDLDGHTIRGYDPGTEQVTTAYGDSALGPGYLDDPAGTGEAQFDTPADVVSDGAGHLYVADQGNRVIRRIDLATGAVTTLVGQAGQSGSADSPASPSFGVIEQLAYASGALYLTDSQYHTIRMVDLATNTVTTLAGTASAGNPGGYADTTWPTPPTAAEFKNPSGIAVRFEGGDRIIYVADSSNHVIRKILTSSGQTSVSTLAGDAAGGGGFADGLGSEAAFNQPTALTLDAAGDLFVADLYNNRIRKVTRQGRVTTHVGTGVVGLSDGPQRGARLNEPTEVLQTGAGLYFFDSNYRLRKLSPVN